MKPVGLILTAAALLAWSGCGTAIMRNYSNRVIGADGQVITLNQIQRIVDDPNLDDEGRWQQIRDLGIEDEKLIEALLEL